jgi:hypothetical protein
LISTSLNGTFVFQVPTTDLKSPKAGLFVTSLGPELQPVASTSAKEATASGKMFREITMETPVVLPRKSGVGKEL